MSVSVLVAYAISFVGVPYKYGGNNPLEGFDCSGLVCEILRAGGVIGREDYSAQGLYEFLKLKNFSCEKKPGAVAFYGKSEKSITHVAFHLTEELVIEAGSGDESVTSLEEAKKKNAFVRVRPVVFRKDYLCSIYPSYILIASITKSVNLHDVSKINFFI